MKITAIRTRHYKIPLRETLISAKFTLTHRELVTIEVETSGGITGTGWFTTPGVGARAARELAEDHLVPALIGADPLATERIWSTLWDRCHYAGPGGLTTLAISGIDIALWDIKGKVAGLPLHRLLGGHSETVGVYASNINLHLEMEALLGQTERQLSAGYGAFKMKLGRAPEEDLERCREVRRLIGPHRELMLDANQKWTPGEAISRCRMLAETGPLFIEEPLLSDDIAGHVHLRAQGHIPVAVGEQLCNRYEFWNYIRAGAVDFVQPCPWKVGGITEWMKVAHAAQMANIRVSPHGALELSVHLAAAVGNAEKIENIFGVSLFDLGASTQELAVVNGVLAPPDAPGHGIVLDGPVLDRH